MRRNSNR